LSFYADPNIADVVTLVDFKRVYHDNTVLEWPCYSALTRGLPRCLGLLFFLDTWLRGVHCGAVRWSSCRNLEDDDTENNIFDKSYYKV